MGGRNYHKEFMVIYKRGEYTPSSPVAANTIPAIKKAKMKNTKNQLTLLASTVLLNNARTQK